MRETWECPCGKEREKWDLSLKPLRTLVALREPVCPLCGRKYEQRIVEEGERDAA
jgi:hypothetical protein